MTDHDFELEAQHSPTHESKGEHEMKIKTLAKGEKVGGCGERPEHH